MKDLIDRQAAINGTKELFLMGEHYCDKFSIVGMLNSLPSVQLDVIKCKDCKYCEKVDHDLMCCNVNSWVIATHDDFGCVLAERRIDGVDR